MYSFIGLCHDVHNVNVYLILTGGIVLSVLSFFSMYCLVFSFLSLSLSLSLKKKVWKGFWERFSGVLDTYQGKSEAGKHPPYLLTPVSGFFWTCLDLLDTWFIPDLHRVLTSCGLAKGLLYSW